MLLQREIFTSPKRTVVSQLERTWGGYCGTNYFHVKWKKLTRWMFAVYLSKGIWSGLSLILPRLSNIARSWSRYLISLGILFVSTVTRRKETARETNERTGQRKWKTSLEVAKIRSTCLPSPFSTFIAALPVMWMSVCILHADGLVDFAINFPTYIFLSLCLPSLYRNVRKEPSISC